MYHVFLFRQHVSYTLELKTSGHLIRNIEKFVDCYLSAFISIIIGISLVFFISVDDSLLLIQLQVHCSEEVYVLCMYEVRCETGYNILHLL